MAVPKRKTSRKRTHDRRAHLRLKKINLTKCANCKTDIMPHRACFACGFYKGKQIITVLTRQEKQQLKKDKKKGKKNIAKPSKDSKKELSIEELSKKE